MMKFLNKKEGMTGMDQEREEKEWQKWKINTRKSKVRKNLKKGKKNIDGGNQSEGDEVD